MGVVTGLTAARMLAIEAASVVDGDIVGNDLVLTKFDGSTVNAGNVRGPIGPQGFVPMLYKATSAFATTIATGVVTIVTGWGHVVAESSSGAASMITLNSNGNFTVNNPGVYAVAFTYTFISNIDGRRVGLIYKNGSETRRSDVGSGGATTPEVVDHMLCTAGDILTFRAYQNSGVVLGTTSPFHDVSILRLS